MTEEEKELFNQMSKLVENNAQNYHTFDTTENFDSVLDFDDEESVLNMNYGRNYGHVTDEMARGLSTYEFFIFLHGYCRCFAGPSHPLPELFQSRSYCR